MKKYQSLFEKKEKLEEAKDKEIIDYLDKNYPDKDFNDKQFLKLLYAVFPTSSASQIENIFNKYKK